MGAAVCFWVGVGGWVHMRVRVRALDSPTLRNQPLPAFPTAKKIQCAVTDATGRKYAG